MRSIWLHRPAGSVHNQIEPRTCAFAYIGMICAYTRISIYVCVHGPTKKNRKISRVHDPIAHTFPMNPICCVVKWRIWWIENNETTTVHAKKKRSQHRYMARPCVIKGFGIKFTLLRWIHAPVVTSTRWVAPVAGRGIGRWGGHATTRRIFGFRAVFCTMGAAASAAMKKPCGADVLQAQPNWLKNQVPSCLPAPEPEPEPSLSRQHRASAPSPWGSARVACVDDAFTLTKDAAAGLHCASPRLQARACQERVPALYEASNGAPHRGKAISSAGDYGGNGIGSRVGHYGTGSRLNPGRDREEAGRQGMAQSQEHAHLSTSRISTISHAVIRYGPRTASLAVLPWPAARSEGRSDASSAQPVTPRYLTRSALSPAFLCKHNLQHKYSNNNLVICPCGIRLEQ